MPKIQRQCAAIDFGVKIGMGAQGLHFRSKNQGALQQSVVERLFARPVPGEMKLAIPSIPKSEREHAVESLQGPLEAPLHNGRKHDLGIGCSPEGMASGSEFLAQSPVVVNLSIKRNDVAAAT